MTRGIRLLLLVALLAAGYALALFGGQAPPPRVAHSDEVEVVLHPPGEPVPRPDRPASADAPVEPPVKHVDMIAPGDGPTKRPRPLVPEGLSEPERRRRLMELQREQRAQNERRIVVAEQRWEREQRDASWAAVHERALQQALLHDRIDQLLVDVECRRTLCRVEFAAVDSNSAIALTGAERFRHELGEQVATRMQGGGLDRVMLIYSARDESTLEP